MNEVSPLLTSILSTRRADGSVGDNNFRLWLNGYLKSIEGVKHIDIGPRGNIIVVTDTQSKTLFSCHVDTCHSKEESNGAKQKIAYDPHLSMIMLDDDAGCLGADDGVGIYLMLEMIKAEVPGTYVFHTGEERGGLGARELLKEREAWLKGFKRAVAFDRPNDDEVIITQGGLQCASVTAGKALCDALNKFNLTYDVSTKGVFTDTKVYAGVIPECFNLGVGYQMQHTPNEFLNYDHVCNLLEAIVQIDWEKLPVARVIEPSKPAPIVYPAPNKVNTAKPQLPIYSFYDEVADYSFTEMCELCEQTPQDAGALLLRLISEVKAKEKQLEVLFNSIGAL